MIKKVFYILAAGASSRYGGCKLTETFQDSTRKAVTLPQLAVRFAIDHGATDICVTLNSNRVVSYKGTISHSVLDRIRYECPENVSLHTMFQPQDNYGTGTAISCWKEYVYSEELSTAQSCILFGDNFYGGKSEVLEQYINLDSISSDVTHDLIFTKIERKHESSENLRLAYVTPKWDVVVEKPHGYTNGEFFAGFVAFNGTRFWNSLSESYQIPSVRGEVEITDIINSCNFRRSYLLDCKWGHLTYPGDYDRVQSLVWS